MHMDVVTAAYMRKGPGTPNLSCLGHPILHPQGTIVMMPLLPYALSARNYGTDALEFKPQRWMTAAGLSDSGITAGATSPNSQAAAEGQPDPLTFMTGQRDW
jgi:hypothetical protein